jgi:hypothetical protein
MDGGVMAATIKVPGVGPVKSKYVYAGAAAVVVIVGVAYARRSMAPTEEATAPEGEGSPDAALDSSAGDPYGQYSDASGYNTVYGPGGSGASADDIAEAISTWWENRDGDAADAKEYATNRDWASAAQGVLADMGVASDAAASAIANVLAGLPVTAVQQRYYLQAVGLLGAPPGNVPTIRLSDTPAQPGTGTTPTLTAPKNLKVTGLFTSHVTLDWDNVAGAGGYTIYRDGARIETVRFSNANVWNMKPGTKHTIQVKAMGADNKTMGPAASVSFTTKKK